MPGRRSRNGGGAAAAATPTAPPAAHADDDMMVCRWCGICLPERAADGTELFAEHSRECGVRRQPAQQRRAAAAPARRQRRRQNVSVVVAFPTGDTAVHEVATAPDLSQLVRIALEHPVGQASGAAASDIVLMKDYPERELSHQEELNMDLQGRTVTVQYGRKRRGPPASQQPSARRRRVAEPSQDADLDTALLMQVSEIASFLQMPRGMLISLRQRSPREQMMTFHRAFRDAARRGTGEQAPAGVTAAEMAACTSIVKFSSDGGEAGMCVVCQETLEDGVELRSLSKCKHHFHPTCIDRWLQRSRECPVCKECVA
eukprot:TRINITY_DN7732_c0_g1_i2.p1 TRINITY_DN7732_c0_g1~~TRINITY_DN7732_c0_g1_i2.p1  ORF type:complete len:342 (+),score=71.55 TRINITY_DN7732_c0_g1_i2:81-1028(+)